MTSVKRLFPEFILLSLLALAVFIPSLLHPFMDIDEILWAEFANSVLKGCPPYVCVIGEKPPLLYLFYTAVFFLFGKNNYLAVHLIHILWVSLTAFFLNRIPSSQRSVLPGLFYILLFGLPGFRMLAATGESLMNPFLILSWILFLKLRDRPSAGNAVLAGVLVAAASLFRHQGGIQIVLYAGWILFFLKTPRRILTAFFLVAGFVGVWSVAMLLLSRWGGWEGYKYWGILYSLGYIQKGAEGPGVWKSASQNLLQFFGTTGVFWLLIRSGSALPWLIASLVAAATGFRFYPHYFIQAFPPLAILGGQGFQRRRSPLIKAGILLSCLGILVQNILSDRLMESGVDKDYAPLNEKIGTYIRVRTNPDDTISLWGWGSGIHYYSGRGMGTRFIHSDFLSGRVSGSDAREYSPELARKFIIPGAWDLFLADLRANRPVYFIDTGPAKVHDYQYFPVSAYPELQEFLNRHYRLETEIEGVGLYRLRPDGAPPGRGNGEKQRRQGG